MKRLIALVVIGLVVGVPVAMLGVLFYMTWLTDHKAAILSAVILGGTIACVLGLTWAMNILSPTKSNGRRPDGGYQPTRISRGPPLPPPRDP